VHTYTDVARDLNGGADLEALQRIVGGYVESVPLDHATHIIVNESGVFDGLPVNELATRVLIAMRPEMAGTLLCGDALFLGFTSAGNETHCPKRIWDLVVRLAAEAGIPFGGPAVRS
jgi:hypothetical protein